MIFTVKTTGKEVFYIALIIILVIGFSMFTYWKLKWPVTEFSDKIIKEKRTLFMSKQQNSDQWQIQMTMCETLGGLKMPCAKLEQEKQPPSGNTYSDQILLNFVREFIFNNSSFFDVGSSDINITKDKTYGKNLFLIENRYFGKNWFYGPPSEITMNSDGTVSAVKWYYIGKVKQLPEKGNIGRATATKIISHEYAVKMEDVTLHEQDDVSTSFYYPEYHYRGKKRNYWHYYLVNPYKITYFTEPTPPSTEKRTVVSEEIVLIDSINGRIISKFDISEFTPWMKDQ